MEDTLINQIDSAMTAQITDQVVGQTLKTVNDLNNPSIQILIIVILGFAGLAVFVSWRMYKDNKELMTGGISKMDAIAVDIPTIKASQTETQKSLEKLQDGLTVLKENHNELDKRVIRLELQLPQNNGAKKHGLI